MAHKLDYLKPPETEAELRRLQDELYKATKEALARKDLPRFKDLLEIISSEVTIIQYYESATWVNVTLSKYSKIVMHAAYKALLRHGGKWAPANTVNNLISVHSKYKTQIPVIEYSGLKVGITSMGFCKSLLDFLDAV